MLRILDGIIGELKRTLGYSQCNSIDTERRQAHNERLTLYLAIEDYVQTSTIGLSVA